MVKSKQFAIIWDELALTEFQEILEYLSGRSILAPKLVKKAVLANIKLISKSPFIFETDKLKKPRANGLLKNKKKLKQNRQFLIFKFYKKEKRPIVK
jgi:hypothetical protein